MKNLKAKSHKLFQLYSKLQFVTSCAKRSQLLPIKFKYIHLMHDHEKVNLYGFLDVGTFRLIFSFPFTGVLAFWLAEFENDILKTSSTPTSPRNLPYSIALDLYEISVRKVHNHSLTHQYF